MYCYFSDGLRAKHIETILYPEKNMSGRGSVVFFWSSDFLLTENSAKLLEVNHDAGVVYSETIQEFTTPPSVDLLLPSADQVSHSGWRFCLGRIMDVWSIGVLKGLGSRLA